MANEEHLTILQQGVEVWNVEEKRRRRESSKRGGPTEDQHPD